MADIYYKLDKKTREELISTVKRVAIEILEGRLCAKRSYSSPRHNGQLHGVPVKR